MKNLIIVLEYKPTPTAYNHVEEFAQSIGRDIDRHGVGFGQENFTIGLGKKFNNKRKVLKLKDKIRKLAKIVEFKIEESFIREQS